jgi:hypothetical protein
MDAATLAWLDQEDAHIGTIIRRYGWFIQYVYGDPMCTEPGCSCSDQDSVPFAYTVGLFGMNHPELLIFGVSQETAGGVLNELGDRIRAGEDLLPGQLVTFERWLGHFRTLAAQDRPRGCAESWRDRVVGKSVLSRPAEVSVPVLQLTYDDKVGRFPWVPGYAAPDMQPRPGTFRA